MSNKRYLPILSQGDVLISNATSTLLGFMNFPNDPRSAFHFASVIAQDAKMQEDNRASGFSRIAEVSIADAERRKGQALVSGYVGLTLVEMYANQRPSGLIRAVEATDAHIRIANKRFNSKLPVSKRSIRSHFETYQPVVSFWAASIAYPSLFEAAANDVEAFKTFLAIAERIERIIEGTIDTGQVEWNPWCVPEVFSEPDFVLSVPQWSTEFVEIIDDYYKRGGN